MHGLIFETSIWLLAGSTRFLRSIFPDSRQGKPKLNEFDSFWDCTQIRKNPNAENSTFIALFKQLRTNQRTQLRVETFCPKLLDQAKSVLPLIANRCETWNSSKVQIQILKHVASPKTCWLRTLHLPTRTHPQKRLKDQDAKLEYFFNVKTYYWEESKINFQSFPICFTFSTEIYWVPTRTVP